MFETDLRVQFQKYVYHYRNVSLYTAYDAPHQKSLLLEIFLKKTLLFPDILRIILCQVSGTRAHKIGKAPHH